MKARLSAYRHQILALLLTAGVALAIYVVLVMPAIDARAEYRERLATAQEQHAAYVRAAGEVPALRKEIAKIRVSNRRDTGFFNSMPPALAAAQLQQRLKSLIEKHGATLASTQVISDSSDSPFRKVAIRVQMRAGVKPMTAIFYELAHSVPVLLTDNVMIQSRNTGDSGTSGVQNGLLDVRFDVYGYMFHPAEP